MSKEEFARRKAVHANFNVLNTGIDFLFSLSSRVNISNEELRGGPFIAQRVAFTIFLVQTYGYI